MARIQDMEECLSLLLTHLEFNYMDVDVDVIDCFLTVIRSPHVLPNLSSITVRWLDPPEVWYQDLLDMLLMRCKQLCVVRLTCAFGEIPEPPQDVCVQLRQLAADGMSIHIGTKKHSFI
ncbi:hypothetical protein B0H17DRAFT_1139171 [Mycena rosella]|uniref:Uncharacterized protein n=1 Tax=Mycena rosella TaxID=1033263 RepID=A0AAD7D582_MYCRO|nr:hypothetical protein B0H17DRAFT_1139171 [Mycena rosella]